MRVRIDYRQTQTSREFIEVPDHVIEAGISPEQYAGLIAQDRINNRRIDWQDAGDDEFVKVEVVDRSS